MNNQNHYCTSHILSFAVIFILSAASIFILAFPESVKADALGLSWGVGGRLVPASPPPFGDFDVLNFAPFCPPLVTIIGPEGANWGVYQWDVGLPYDYWFQSYAVNGWPYTHADEYMLGYATPSMNTCPIPMLHSLGDSLYKASF